MKKLVVILLIAVLSLSTLFLTSCGKETAEGDEDISISTSSEKTKPIRSFDNDDDSTTSASTSESSEESDDPAESDKPDTSYGADGEDYVVKEIDTSTLSTNAKIVANYINDVGRVTAKNYTAKLDDISYIITQYNALTSNEKNEVSNYQSLLEAKDACDKFAKSVSDQAIADFKTTIETLKSFQVNETYKSNVAEANSILENVAEQYRSTITNEIAILRASEFAIMCTTLPDTADGLRLSHADTVNELTEKLSTTPAIKNQNGITPFVDKYNILNTKLLSSTVQRAFIANDENNDGVVSATEAGSAGKNEAGTDGSGFFKVPTSNGSDSACTYTDLKNNAVKVARVVKGSPATFTAPCAGKLVVWCRASSNQTYKITLAGTEIFSQDNINAITKIEIDIPSSGEVKIFTVESGKERFFALNFSYPNLPA